MAAPEQPIELVTMTPEFLEALLAGRPDEAARLGGFSIPTGWPDGPEEAFLRFRLKQLRERPEFRDWLVRAIVLDGELIGHAGYHGPPGVNARRDPRAVELGYRIFEPHRGRGRATAAVRELMRWAEAHGVSRFVASVAPDNAPSLAIVRKLGFIEVGRHWDEEDGEELEFELAL